MIYSSTETAVSPYQSMKHFIIIFLLTFSDPFLSQLFDDDKDEETSKSDAVRYEDEYGEFHREPGYEDIIIDNLYLCKWCGIDVITDPSTEQREDIW